MSTEILFDTTGRRLTGKSGTKQESMSSGLKSSEAEILTENENSSTEAQGSAAETTKSSLTQSLNRKIDYSIQQESNEIIIKVLDGETGEVIREIPQQDFVRLVDRASVVNKNILDQTA